MSESIVFRLGRREAELNRIDAKEIRGRAVARTLAAKWLYDAIGRALADESDRADVIVNEESVRQEILLDLQAIAAEHPLTDEQQALWDAAENPILP